LVASLGFHAALVVGEKREVKPEMIPQLVEELGRFRVRISKHGELIAEGFGRNLLGSPALCLAELSSAIARRFPSEPLSAGELVSSGTLAGAHATSRGDVWTAEVEGVSLSALTLRLS
jgi:2-keto-4-pentenoate hydratase